MDELAPVVDRLDELPHRPERMVLGGWFQGANVVYSLAFGAGRPRPAVSSLSAADSATAYR